MVAFILNTLFDCYHLKTDLKKFGYLILLNNNVNVFTVGIWNLTIWNPDLLKVGFQMVRFSNGWAYVMAIIVPTIWNPDVSVRISNGFWQKGGCLSDFQMAELPVFRSCSKSGPFTTQPLFKHSKSGLVQISDSHCNFILFQNIFRRVQRVNF